MEYFGINLNGNKQKTWYKNSIKTLFYLALIGSISIGLSIFLFLFSNNIFQENQKLIEKSSQFQRHLTDLENRISAIKQSQTFTTEIKLLDKNHIKQIIYFIQILPFNGGVESITISQAEEIEIRCLGKLSTAEFDQLEQKLRALNADYHILHLQNDKKETLEFDLMIKWRDQNETHDQ